MANDAHRRVVHESAWRRPTPCGIDLPAINHAKGRNRFCAHALHFDTLRDKRTGDEDRLLSHFFLSLLAHLDRRIGKHGAGRDENRNASSYYTFHIPKYTRQLALQIALNTRRNRSLPRLPRIQRLSLESS